MTVIVKPGEGPRSAVVSVSELAAARQGRESEASRPWDPAFGFWIRVRGDQVLALDQAYRP